MHRKSPPDFDHRPSCSNPTHEISIVRRSRSGIAHRGACRLVEDKGVLGEQGFVQAQPPALDRVSGSLGLEQAVVETAHGCRLPGIEFQFVGVLGNASASGQRKAGWAPSEAGNTSFPGLDSR